MYILHVYINVHNIYRERYVEIFFSIYRDRDIEVYLWRGLKS
jgi:hypothetical protein